MENALSSEPKVFLFAGQGSQYFHMGRELYEAGGVFSFWMDNLDKALIGHSGRSVIAALYDDKKKKSEPLVDTQISHPAIFMLEVALAYDLIDRGVRPDLTMGVSMGSFAAAVIAGCIEVEEGLKLVVHQAEIFRAHCRPGGMIAILAHVGLHSREPLRSRSVIASLNFDSHFVVSAKAEDLVTITEFLESERITHQRLPVAFAYHSPWIDDAGTFFKNAFAPVSKIRGKIPVACCATAQTYTELPSEFLWSAVRKPVRFQDTIQSLEAVRAHRYLDVGASGTLVTFLKYLLPRERHCSLSSVLDPYGGDLRSLNSVSKTAS